MTAGTSYPRFKFFCVCTVVCLVARAARRWSSDRAMERALDPEYIKHLQMMFREVNPHAEARKEKEAIEGAKSEQGPISKSTSVASS